MIYFNWSTSVLVLEVLLFSHRPIKIEAAYISCSLPEAKIITANQNLPLNTEQWSTQNKKNGTYV